MTQYTKPATLEEALALRAAHPDFLVLAGGTDAMVDLPRREGALAGVIDLFGLAPLSGITPGDGYLPCRRARMAHRRT